MSSLPDFSEVLDSFITPEMRMFGMILVIVVGVFYLISIIWVIRDSYLRGSNPIVWGIIALIPFIGAFVDSKMAAASKVVKKKHADERVGVFVYKNGLPGIIEYSEISPELAATLDGGNILSHLFTMDSLKKLEKESLPWHFCRCRPLWANS